jgi:photosystem II stability/assembly factor-like uncharacterized protein
MKRITTFTIFIILSTFTNAQWFWQNPVPSGTNFYSVKFASAYVGWAVGWGGTIIKTTDEGISWSSQSSGTTNILTAISFYGINTGTVIGYNGTILRTTNGGLNWISQTTGTTDYLNSVSFTDEKNGTIVGSGWNGSISEGKIYRTTDGGTTWNLQDSGITGLNGLNCVFFSDLENGTAAGDSGTIIRTIDGGNSWTKQTSGITQSLYDVSFTNKNSGTAVGALGIILYTSNGGNIWEIKSAPGSFFSSAFKKVCFADENNGYITGGYYHLTNEPYLYKTTDGGITWVSISMKFYLGRYFAGVSFSDSNTGIIAGSNGLIIRTTDGGTSWSNQTQVTDQNLSGVYFSDANIGTAVGWNGIILRTTNGGSNWLVQSGSSTESMTSVFFTDINYGIAAGFGGTILRTTNGGSIWLVDTISAYYALRSVSFSDANNGIIGGSGGSGVTTGMFLKTTNGGISWIFKETNTVGLWDVVLLNANTAIAVDQNGSILKSTDGGSSWNTVYQSSPYWISCVCFTSVNTGLAIGSGVAGIIILKTTDGGDTWTQISGTPGIFSILSVSASGPGGWTIVVRDSASNSLIFKSTNDGITWNTQTNPTTNRLNCVFFTDANNGTAVGDNGTILRTTNGGITFIGKEIKNLMPHDFILFQNYPNPFNPGTVISYSLPSAANVKLIVYNTLGQTVKILGNGYRSAGNYSFNFNASTLPSGIYFYKLEAGQFSQVKKMILIK